MPAERFYIDDNLQNNTITFSDTEFHHLTRVMRVRVGAEIEIVNGRGGLATGRVESISRREAEISILDYQVASRPKTELTLLQAIPRLNRLDTIVEKATELGMTSLWLFPGKLSEKKSLSNQQQLRIVQLMIAAMKQCGRLYLPTIRYLDPIAKWTELPAQTVFGDVSPDAPLLINTIQGFERNSISFIIGPESGLTADEETCLKKLDAHGVKLHNNILRTDTAPIVALSVVAHWQMT